MASPRIAAQFAPLTRSQYARSLVLLLVATPLVVLPVMVAVNTLAGHTVFHHGWGMVPCIVVGSLFGAYAIRRRR